MRWLGTFLEDPVDVPGEVLDFVAGQPDLAPGAIRELRDPDARDEGDE